jgi:hypothetical protein
MSLAFGQRDYLKAVPIGMDDPEKARLLSRLLMGALESPNVFLTNYLGYKDAYIFGTSIMELGWERCSRMQMTPQGPQQIMYRDAPLLRQVDLYDFYPDPMGTRIQHDMVGVAKRFRITKAQALELAQLGVYDMQVVQRLIQRNGKDSESRSTGGPIRFPDEAKQAPRDTGVLEGFEYWGMVPHETPDGAQNRVITLLEGEVVRSSINPYFDGKVPFKEIVVNPIAGRFYGLGPGEVIRYLQDSTDHRLMNLDDAVGLAVHVPLLVGASVGANPNQLKNRSLLDIIQCSGDVTNIAPIPVDLNALQFATADMVRGKMTMREATGATNPTQAIPSGDRTTATEINTLTESASKHTALMVQVYERDYLNWLGCTYHYRLRQFGSPEYIVTLEGEPFLVRLEDVDYESDVRFMGSLHAKTKAQEAMAYTQFLTVANPDSIKYFPQVVIRFGRDVLDIKDAELMVKQAQQQMAIDMMLQGMMGAVQQQADAEEEVAKAASSKKKGSSPKAKAAPAGTPSK